jgi:hypothetical protein
MSDDSDDDRENITDFTSFNTATITDVVLCYGMTSPAPQSCRGDYGTMPLQLSHFKLSVCFPLMA